VLILNKKINPMKKLFFSKSLLFSVIFGGLLTSCNTTDTGVITPTVANGPSSNLLSGTGITNQDASVTVGTEFTVNLTATQGDQN
jgi:hypothetical protein